MKNLTNLTQAIKITVPALVAYLLTGCQTTPIAVTSHTPSPSLNPEQSQKLLVATIKSSLYHNQDWVAEQQLFLQDLNKKDPTQVSRLHQIEQCQSEHDKALVAQLKADKITSYHAIKKLTEDKKIPYETIKKTYIDCYHTAKNLAEDEEDTPVDVEELGTETSPDTEDYPEEVGMAMKVLGFKSGQITNFNNFFAKSGKIIYTGNYRPLQGKLALQVDAGFENKNLRTHYRLPMVADFKNQVLYLKPDVIMPYTALYLDNKMGMSWQDKWYQFTPGSQPSMPASLSKKATAKAWLKAITDSFLALPSEQFSTATPAEINSELLPNLVQNPQQISQQPTQNLTNSQVIHWHQTADEQIALTKATIRRYIAIMESNLANDKGLLTLPTSEQTRYRKQWEKQKKQLLAYSDNLSKKSDLTVNDPSDSGASPAEKNATKTKDFINHISDNSSDNGSENASAMENEIENKDEINELASDESNSDEYNSEDSNTEDIDASQPSKRPFLASRPQGQDWYFVLANNGLKHIYIDNGVTVFDQPAKFHTWVTFNPDNRKLATANQPQTLENLASTLRPATIIDGRAEMKRLAELDDSRRLFGQEPKVVKYYRDYMKKSKEAAKKEMAKKENE